MNRVASLVVAVLMAGLAPASAQAPGPAAPARKPAAQAPAATPKPAPKPATVPAWAGVPEPERIAVQSDLIWTGDYNGVIGPEFGERAFAAVKTFQKRYGYRQTGVLEPAERSRLAEAARAAQGRVGWTVRDDRTSGVRLGLPAGLVPKASPAPGGTGTHWQSGKGEVQVDTFRVAGPDVTLSRLFEQQKKEPKTRRPDYAVMKGDFFVVSGFQGLKKFYVRAHGRDREVRGMVLLYDQGMEGTLDPVAVAMSSAFVPFPESTAGVPPPRRRVEYASAAVVSAAGDLVAEARTLEQCRSVQVAGRGYAEIRATADGLALLHLWGAHGLAPLALAEAGPSGDVTLVGIADPERQDGGGAVSTLPARLGPGGTLAAPPPAGFSGAAAVDAAGRLVGVVTTAPVQVAGPGAAGAGLVPADTVRRLLAAHGITPGPTAPPAADPKAAVVRVICVRD
ncbi:peptidoglycan-binding domain-containing protein [Rhodoplanes sp. TEM]|uniref:Peptidoglycan-binding domain-containing protein n=1 Tax=Rhodoplanes tepidamans TaxID=200616 RepID=A0ABT5J8Y0_RHOTP|nr:MULTISPECIES: peptidoglycan-binding domain-containing protein [Rhodoplanes]MDC7786114.1 peptidoglycan-binding domain-containing protein [Rhodoplanes tepidamans]MDC7982781.1 peptidoglycan-binding domain-containing protein [Rhodoplanes sp. TEM]MDQ0357221.1 peptidoglycan hydrolase-like protein with peptidoglycan-binding domain [Rhodoplanes tepidamans]